MNISPALFEARQRQRDVILSRSRRVSSFRGLPQSAAVPYAELSRLRLAYPPLQQALRRRGPAVVERSPPAPHRRWSSVC
jgi:hypothetical protein